ncbi:F-box protein: endocytic membrane traffic, recycling ReCYcling 1 [Allomyces javanicus]|nr:F-box protein: endocytic membrane traffic, recycling ReCYcling 1 [Allomyces javanicus]
MTVPLTNTPAIAGPTKSSPTTTVPPPPLHRPPAMPAYDRVVPSGASHHHRSTSSASAQSLPVPATTMTIGARASSPNTVSPTFNMNPSSAAAMRPGSRLSWTGLRGGAPASPGLSGMFALPPTPTTPTRPAKAVRIAAFPQDITLRIFSYLPLPTLAALAASSRRLKVIAYNDVLHERKLRLMQYLATDDAEATGSVAFACEGGDVPILPGANDLVPRRRKRDKVPLHVAEAWTRAAPLLVNGRSLEMAWAVPLGQARAALRRVHTVLWPYYVDFRPGTRECPNPAPGSKVASLADPMDRAMFLTLLLEFGRAAVVPDSHEINENIRADVLVFESALLSDFDRSLENGDVEGQRRAATALFLLNGGGSCVQLFIYKSPIFFDHSRDVTENLTVLSLEGGHASPLQHYLDTISATLETHLPRIPQIFPHPRETQYQYVQQAFNECILDYLSRLLREASSRDLAVFLGSLTLIFEHCSALLAMLARRGLDPARVEAMLHTCLDPFTARYMPRELAHLRRRAGALVDAWQADLSARRAARAARRTTAEVEVETDGFGRRVLSSVKTVLFTPHTLMHKAMKRAAYVPAVGVVASAPSPTATTQSAARVSAASSATTLVEVEDEEGEVGGTDVQDNGDDEFDEPLDALLSTKLVEEMIELHRTSIKRCVIMMRPQGDVKPHVETIHTFMLRTLGEKHIQPCYAIANERLSTYKASEDIEVLPLIQLFAMNKVADTIVHMLDTFFTESIAPFVNPNDFLTEAIQEKRAFEKLVDDCVATGLDRAMLTLMAQVEFLLAAEQPAADYDPPENPPDLSPTPACQVALACLDKHLQILLADRNPSPAERQMVQVFVGEVGSRFFGVVTKHIKRYRVSRAGGIRMLCDVNAYQEWADKLRNAEVSRLFRALKELVNVYIVGEVSILKQLVKDQARYNGVFRVEDLYEFVERRTDYEKIRGRIRESECMIM